MDKKKMNSIAGWVIEYEIYETYWTIINDILERHGENGIDCDDISSTREFCDNVFNKITGEDIYRAIGAAYNYHWRTIKQKIERECERTKIATEADIRKNIRSFTDRERELAYQEDYIRRVLIQHSNKNKPFVPLNKKEHWITKDDILEINKIIMDRTKKIYGNHTVSDISPALKKFWDFSAKIEVSDSGFRVEPKCEVVKTQHERDAETIKNGLKDVAKIYDDQGCTNICYEINLDNGHKWAIRFDKLWVRDSQNLVE